MWSRDRLARRRRVRRRGHGLPHARSMGVVLRHHTRGNDLASSSDESRWNEATSRTTPPRMTIRVIYIKHLRIRFISVQDQVDTDSPMGKAMFTIIGAMAELESSLISERVKAGMEAARARGKRLGRPLTPAHCVARIEALAGTTDMSIRQIQHALKGRVDRSVVGEIVKRVRDGPQRITVTGFYPYPDVVGESGR